MNRLVSIAPMIDWTDRHCRYWLRLITHKAWLYTEMIVARAIIHGDPQKLLAFNQQEHPLAVQLGGSEPRILAAAAKICEQFGYDEINLNVGCPSERVVAGSFGACLMAEPQLVAECVAAMQQVVALPITVKTRIGIDQHDSYEFLANFIATVAQTGCEVFIIHARKAWLKGLSPKQNRSIPELKYEIVHRLKQEFPHLNIIINGGITELQDALAHNELLDGVMIGREAYTNPYKLSEIDSLFYNDFHPILKRYQLLELLAPYIEQELSKGGRIWSILRHTLGICHGLKDSKQWRRFITEHANKPQAGMEVVFRAIAMMKAIE